jgi:hypothetical protein
MSGLSEPRSNWDDIVSTSDRVHQLLDTLVSRQEQLQVLHNRTATINLEIDRLDAAYTAARAVCDDVAIMAILQLLTATHTLRMGLLKLQQSVAGQPINEFAASPSTSSSPSGSIDEPSPSRISTEDSVDMIDSAAFTGLTLQSVNETGDPVHQAVVHSNLHQEPAPEPPVYEVVVAPTPPTLDDEGERLLAAIVATIQTDWEHLSADMESVHHIPSATLFRIRALVCRTRAIQEENAVYEPVPEGVIVLSRILSDIALCCMNGTSDCLIRFRIDPDQLERDESLVDFWNHLAKVYSLTAEAEDAMNWCREADFYPTELINTIAARQQMLYVLAEQVGYRDENQQSLFHAIKARPNAEFLTGLSPTLAYNDLSCIAGKLQSELQQEQRRRDDLLAQEQKNALRDQAMSQLRSLVEGRADFGTDTSRFEEDKASLHAALDCCTKAGIPASCKDVTSLIGPCADRLLSGTARFRNHMKYAVEHLKKAKRDEEADRLDKEEDIEATDAQMRDWIASLKPLVAGKVLTIAGGGRPQDTIVSTLKSNLPFSDVSWLYGEQLNTSRKIQSNIKKSDIFLVVIKFISHDVSENGKKWMQEKGGDFIPLRAGFGVKSILKALVDTYVVANEQSAQD